MKDDGTKTEQAEPDEPQSLTEWLTPAVRTLLLRFQDQWKEAGNRRTPKLRQVARVLAKRQGTALLSECYSRQVQTLGQAEALRQRIAAGMEAWGDLHTDALLDAYLRMAPDEELYVDEHGSLFVRSRQGTIERNYPEHKTTKRGEVPRAETMRLHVPHLTSSGRLCDNGELELRMTETGLAIGAPGHGRGEDGALMIVDYLDGHPRLTAYADSSIDQPTSGIWFSDAAKAQPAEEEGSEPLWETFENVNNPSSEFSHYEVQMMVDVDDYEGGKDAHPCEEYSEAHGDDVVGPPYYTVFGKFRNEGGRIDIRDFERREDAVKMVQRIVGPKKDEASTINVLVPNRFVKAATVEEVQAAASRAYAAQTGDTLADKLIHEKLPIDVRDVFAIVQRAYRALTGGEETQ